MMTINFVGHDAWLTIPVEKRMSLVVPVTQQPGYVFIENE